MYNIKLHIYDMKKYFGCKATKVAINFINNGTGYTQPIPEISLVLIPHHHPLAFCFCKMFLILVVTILPWYSRLKVGLRYYMHKLFIIDLILSSF